MSYNAHQIANWIITKAQEDENSELITNLKLQKLLYYFQGFYLAAFDKTLFSENIEAWQYGPVVPVVYEYHKPSGKNALNSNPNYNLPNFNEEEETLLNNVFETYNEFSAIGLMNLTHEEKPWKNTPVGKGSVISPQLLTDFFKTRLED